MFTPLNQVIAIEVVLLAFSTLGIFSLPLKFVPKRAAILLKLFFSLALVSFWASLIWSDLYPDFDNYFTGMFVVHSLFLVLSFYAIFLSTRKITKKWIRYPLMLMGFAFISCLEYIMAIVVTIGIGY